MYKAEGGKDSLGDWGSLILNLNPCYTQNRDLYLLLLPVSFVVFICVVEVFEPLAFVIRNWDSKLYTKPTSHFEHHTGGKWWQLSSETAMLRISGFHLVLPLLHLRWEVQALTISGCLFLDSHLMGIPWIWPLAASQMHQTSYGFGSPNCCHAIY